MTAKRNAWSAPTLNEVLAHLRMTTEPAEFGAKKIIENGIIVFSGTAGEVWTWLREDGAIRSSCIDCQRSHEQVELDIHDRCEICHDWNARVAARQRQIDIEDGRGEYLRDQTKDGVR